MWPKCNCCCPDFCLLKGDSHAPCEALGVPVGQVPPLYELCGDFRLRNEGETACGSTLVGEGLFREEGDCKWSALDLDGNEWELEIHSPTDATLKLILLGGGEIVWKPVPDGDPICKGLGSNAFSPLCTSVFAYDEFLSDPPGTPCEYPRCICVCPVGICCDARGLRPSGSGLPLTLFATINYCVGDAAGEPVVIPLTWDEDEEVWKGSGEVSTGTLFLILTCTCGEFAGCGGDCNPLRYWHTACGTGTAEAPNVTTTDNCTCDPFEETFDLGDANVCCGAEAPHGWSALITE